MPWELRKTRCVVVPCLLFRVSHSRTTSTAELIVDNIHSPLSAFKKLQLQFSAYSLVGFFPLVDIKPIEHCQISKFWLCSFFQKQVIHNLPLTLFQHYFSKMTLKQSCEASLAVTSAPSALVWVLSQKQYQHFCVCFSPSKLFFLNWKGTQTVTFPTRVCRLRCFILSRTSRTVPHSNILGNPWTAGGTFSGERVFEKFGGKLDEG